MPRDQGRVDVKDIKMEEEYWPAEIFMEERMEIPSYTENIKEEQIDEEEEQEDEGNFNVEEYETMERVEEMSSEEESDSEANAGENSTPDLKREHDTIKWKLQTPVHRAPNKIKTNHVSSVIGNARYAKTAQECWQAFFTDSILQHIVDTTNKYINAKRNNFKRERDCRVTDLVELKAFIAILYMAGFYKSSKLNMKDFWSTDSSGVEFFHLVMSIKRFYFLMQNINLDNIETSEANKAIDKLAPVREVFEMFVARCLENYSAGDLVTIDKLLIKYKGKCPFLQYIPGRPNRYGIHVYTLVDVKTLYSLNLEIYVGEQTDGPFKVDYTPREVVTRICTPISESGRNVTGTISFTSFELVKELQECHQLTYVGSVKKNKIALPTNFATSRGRNLNSSLFATNENITLMSYIPAKRKNILILSSLHHAPLKIVPADSAKKPEILDFYDTTKTAVDSLDSLSSQYTVSRCANRWPMSIFYAMLNIGAVNAHIIYKENKNLGLEKLGCFIKDLALSLAKDQIKRRSESLNLPRKLKRRATEVCQENCKDEMKIPKVEVIAEQCSSKGGRKRCYICTRVKNRLTRYTCEKCQKYICLQHAKYICMNCNEEDSE